MCGRYTVLTEMEIIEVRGLLRELSIRLARDEFELYDITPGEVRPTNYAPIISQNDDGVYFESAKWGFKPYKGTGVIFNARSETIGVKPMFAKSAREKRCVVPASEYFEWKDIGKKKKQKHHIKDKEGNILYMAGLYRDTPNGREFVIITKNPCGEVADIHDRMPAVLKVGQIPDWLNGELSSEELSELDVLMDVIPADDGPYPEGNGGQTSLFSRKNSE